MSTLIAFMNSYTWGNGCGLFGFGRGMHGGGWIMWIVGLVLVGLLVFLLVKGNRFSGKKSGNPLEQLKKRYVNGEISKEEFLEKKEFLKTQ